jgi:uncharacterized DUF497 family protein
MGIHFEIAVRVFQDSDYLTEQDREVDGEERWLTIGWIGDVMVVAVAHTVEDEDGGRGGSDYLGAKSDQTGKEAL